MDSKSISRKGVGVRLPSLAPASEPAAPRRRELALAARELGALSWEGFRCELERAQVGLERLSASLAADRAQALRCTQNLERYDSWDEGTRRVGWCLGVLAAASGADCLLRRREPRGLQWMVEAVVHALGLELFPRVDALPSSLHGETAWEVPLLGAWCALQAASRGAGQLRWNAHRESGWNLAFEANVSDAGLEARVARLSSAPSGRVRLALAPGRLVLSWS